MGKSQEAQFAEQVINFIVRLSSNPMAAKDPAELNGIIAIFKVLAGTMTGMTVPTAQRFEQFLRDLAIDPALRETVKGQIQPQNALGTPLPQMPPLPPPNASEQDLIKYQKQMQDYTNMMQMLSTILRDMHETRKSIIQNVRG